MNSLGKFALVAGNGQKHVDIFLFHNGGQSVEEVNKAFIVLAAHFEGSVDINVSDVVVAGEDTGNETVKLVIGGDAVMLSLSMRRALWVMS